MLQSLLLDIDKKFQHTFKLKCQEVFVTIMIFTAFDFLTISSFNVPFGYKS